MSTTCTCVDLDFHKFSKSVTSSNEESLFVLHSRAFGVEDSVRLFEEVKWQYRNALREMKMNCSAHQADGIHRKCGEGEHEALDSVELTNAIGATDDAGQKYISVEQLLQYTIAPVCRHCRSVFVPR